jgi:CRP-like cAMP-binding protein
MALITDAPRNATVEAMEDTVLQVFLKDDFMTLIQQSTHGQEMKREIRRRIIENGRR